MMEQAALLERDSGCEAEQTGAALAVEHKTLYLACKRILDILIVLLVGAVAALPMLLIGILIRLDSKGPAIFKQKRMGKDGKVFTIYKFRTMLITAPPDMATGKFGNADTYITRMGSFLRRTSIDELPQLWNILKGDMSLVGYRPLCITETEPNMERARLGIFAMRPGITGLAQVSGRNNVSDEEKVALDARYVRECGFKMDLFCLIKTVATVITGEGAA